MIDILVVDDHESVRRGLAELFADLEGFAVVAAVADGSEAAAAVQRLQPHVVLMDISMPGMDGITATKTVLAVRPQARVVILSGSVTGAAVHGAHAAGVAGYQLKSADPAELVDAVRAAAAGRGAWCRQAADVLGRIH